jgi:ABC-type dipeptide/oligopeptide/nickel transport system permease component
MVVYNLAWGVAWFAFMSKEWLDAMAAIRRPAPWTAEVWFLWVVLTLPIGVAIVAYAASRARSVSKTAVSVSVAVWVLMTLGMAGWAWQASLSMRVIALDSTVNLVSMVAASLAGGWSLHDA